MFSTVDNTAQLLFRDYQSIIQGFVLALCAAFVVSKAMAYRDGLKAVNHIPGFRVPFHPFSLPGVLIPTNWWNPGFNFMWDWRETLYKRFGTDTISLVPFFAGPTSYYTSNIDVLRQVASSNGGRSFIKPESGSRSLLAWGMNLIAADRDTWRKHRRIMGPAFNNKLYEAVWEETIKTYREMISEEGWASKDHIMIPAVQSLTFKLALLIIGKCGFGFSFNWSDPARMSNGRLSVQEALRIVADSFMISSFVPQWIQKLPLKSMRPSWEAQQELRGFMREQVAERKADIRAMGSERDASDANVFSMLVRANEDEEAKFKLDDSELIGNIYIILLAGHETTAHTLAATLGFLAVYDDIQEVVYQEIISVVGNKRDPIFEDYDKLNKVLATFFEALRMFPSGYIMIREAFEDTVLQIPNPPGDEGSRVVPVPKKQMCWSTWSEFVSHSLIPYILPSYSELDIAEYNPRYFEDPFEYRPSRWYEVSNESEAVSAFSLGPRACLGRKFATTEVVAFLTVLIRDYKVVPILDGNETIDDWKKRVLDAKLRLTLGVKDIPISFISRAK